MKRDEAISRLQQHEAELKRLGVEHLYMFGSTARGEAKDNSDVDLFFDYEKGKLGLFELMDVKEYAAGILGRKADIMTRDSLHKVLREKIEINGGPRVLMVARSLVPRLTDIVEAIERIHDVLENISLQAFETDWQRQWLVQRGVEIISEASRHLTDEMKRAIRKSPQKVAAIGNVLRHNYENIAAPVIWKLAQTDLPALEKVCRIELDAERRRGG